MPRKPDLYVEIVDHADTTMQVVGDQVLDIAGAADGDIVAVHPSGSLTTRTLAQLGIQPLDADLTAIAALATTGYGRAFLALANRAALLSLLALTDADLPSTLARDSEVALNLAAAAASTQRVMALLTKGVTSFNLLVITDSTGGSVPATASDRWPYKVTAGLAAMFPALTFQYAGWSPNTLAGIGTNSYDAPTVIQVGTGTGNGGGPFVVTLYNFGVGNSSTDFALGDFEVGVTAIQPSLVFISHGHNEQAGLTPLIETPTQYKGQMFALSEAVAAACPKAAIVLVGQNPDPTNMAEQAARVNEYQMVAQSRGYGFIDIFQTFVDYGAWQNDLMQTPTDKHPNATGQTLWANEVLKAFTYVRQAPQKAEPPSAFVTPGELLNVNHDFSVWTDTAKAPDGYRVSGCTATKDQANYENADTGYGVVLTAAGGAPFYIEQVIPLAPLQARYRNQPITVAVRLYIPTAMTVTTMGSVQVGSVIGSNGDPGNVTFKNARSDTIRRGKFVNVVLAHNLSSIASFIVVRVYGNTANATAGDTITLDRICVTRGIEPRLRSSKPATALPVVTIANPAAIPTQAFKWEADDLTGTGLSQGDPITQLTDTSGNARHATQATSGKRWTWDPATTINGKPTAKATAASNQFYATAYVQPSKVTQYVVYTSYVSGSFIGGVGTTFGQSQDATSVHMGRNPADRRMLFPTTRTLTEAGAHLLVMSYDYDDGTYAAWLDGERVGLRDPGFTVLNPAVAYVLGAYKDTGSNQPLDANVAFLCIASRLHSAAERRGVQDMLAARYALTLVSRV